MINSWSKARCVKGWVCRATPKVGELRPWRVVPVNILFKECRGCFDCTSQGVKAMGAMALLPTFDASFACDDQNTYMAHPWCPFPLRRAHPGPGPHIGTCRECAAWIRFSLSPLPLALSHTRSLSLSLSFSLSLSHMHTLTLSLLHTLTLSFSHTLTLSLTHTRWWRPSGPDSVTTYRGTSLIRNRPHTGVPRS